jgi:protein TonB
MIPKKNPSKDVHRYYTIFICTGLAVSLLLISMAFQWRSKKKVPGCILPPIDTPIFIMEAAFVPEPVNSKSIQEKKVSFRDISRVVPSDEELPVDTFSFQPIEHHLPELSTPTPIEPAGEPVTDTFLVVEKMPVPAGGYPAFYQFLSSTIRYPVQAKRLGTEGKVYIEFVVDKSGTPVNLRIVKGIGGGCDAEAARVIGLSKWEAGRQRGKPVPVKMVLPVSFRID